MTTLEELKRWFEANYLDGDEIQKGQMHSSEDCFDAIKEAVRRTLDECVEMVEHMRDDSFYVGVERHRNKERREILNEVITKLKEHEKILEFLKRWWNFDPEEYDE